MQSGHRALISAIFTTVSVNLILWQAPILPPSPSPPPFVYQVHPSNYGGGRWLCCFYHFYRLVSRSAREIACQAAAPLRDNQD